MTAEQITSVTTALTSAINTVVTNFIDLLPIIAVVVGASFAIRFVSKKFREVKRMG